MRDVQGSNTCFIGISSMSMEMNINCILNEEPLVEFMLALLGSHISFQT
jgi:hypothetical protein